MNELAYSSRNNSTDSSTFTNSTGSTGKRPESVAQRILRERQNRNLKTRYMTESQAIKMEHQRSRRRSSSESTGKSDIKTVPLHIALKQTASQHTTRTQTADRIQKEAHLEAVKSFKVRKSFKYKF